MDNIGQPRRGLKNGMLASYGYVHQLRQYSIFEFGGWNRKGVRKPLGIRGHSLFDPVTRHVVQSTSKDS